MFGPRSKHDLLPNDKPGLCRIVFEPYLALANGNGRCGRRAANFTLDEIHRGRTNETCDIEVLGLVIDRVRVVKLLDHATFHHRDPVGQCQRLDLVVGHIDHRVAKPLVQALDFHPQFGAKLGIKIGQRLVEQEHVNIAHQCPADCHALPLAA